MYRFILILVFSVVLPGVVYAQASCVSAKCHVAVASYDFVHGPVAAGQCDVCHRATPAQYEEHAADPRDFTAFISPTGEDPVCVMCHTTKMEGRFVHGPVETGDCVACHNPHGGSTKFFVAADREADVCFTCHENDKTVKHYLHGPVAAGECASCHTPHASDYEFQLRAPADTICYECHGDKREWLENPVVHEPFTKGCSSCHDPHNSNAKFHLKAESETEVCLSCHAEVSPELTHTIENAKYPHKPVAEGSCGDCHNPHASQYGKLLRSTEQEVCFECHGGIGSRVKGKKFIHGPVETGGCDACHSAHGSDSPFILYSHFPEKFYNQYVDGLYDLCFECHSETVLDKPTTTTDTAFRNGEENLHYTHVMITGKGRSCKSCHEVHASDQPNHVRTSVPYGTGGWELPITFTKTAEGGNCVVGCHKPKSYSREKRVNNP